MNELRAFWHFKNEWRDRGLLNFLRQDDWRLLRAGHTQTPILHWFFPYCEEAQIGLAELEAAARHHSWLTCPLSA
jgi:hypothetical protein